MGLFLSGLSLTLVLEAPVFLAGLRHRPWKERVSFWLAANVYSYPAVFFLFPYLPLSAGLCQGLAEVWAPLCEIAVGAFILPKFTRRDALVVVAANLFSWLVGGLLLRA